ncbi:NAD(P)-binding protein [Limnoraphis robusta CCNP1324]|nr:NAD(P)-binding protein [Limnoraphis robusta]MEA5549359.1 NAD(P)-binding protein [Limnoraphis robusta CCNP1324]
MEKTVGIIGAGIAGMAAGIRLANKGYEVTIFDGNDSLKKRKTNCQFLFF